MFFVVVFCCCFLLFLLLSAAPGAPAARVAESEGVQVGNLYSLAAEELEAPPRAAVLYLEPATVAGSRTGQRRAGHSERRRPCGQSARPRCLPSDPSREVGNVDQWRPRETIPAQIQAPERRSISESNKSLQNKLISHASRRAATRKSRGIHFGSAGSLHSRHCRLFRRCKHTSAPPQCQHSRRRRECSQISAPTQSRH